jgi:hypothetical protein
MFIMGTTFTNWIKLLLDHRFRVSLKRFHKVILITVMIIILTPFSIVERLIIHPRVRRKDLDHPPVFILGHWRSGTTHLHNMFTIDQRLTYPNMVDTLFPNHMILTNWLIRPLLALALPDKRPMDNMKLSVDVPGEQDWAISNLCLMTPYSGAYFPNELVSRYEHMTNFENASDKERSTYVKYIRFYLKKLQYKYPGRQIVLKSPMDTARAKLLYETFPDAKFIHIRRNPYEVFYSTLKLHTKNKDIYPLQEDNRNLEEFIFKTYNGMFDIYFEDAKAIPAEQLIEISYEELKEDRMSVMKEIYDHLDLPDFEGVRDDLQKYVDSLKGYKADDYELEVQEKDLVYTNLKKTIDLWGYTVKVRGSTS